MIRDELNLPPFPPGFRGFDPDLPIRIYHRHLPHWRQDGATYFVTFRLADSIPQPQLHALKRWRSIWERQNPPPRSDEQWQELGREITRRTEAYLDEGYGVCPLADSEHAALVSEALLHFQDVRCFTSCFIVMPNHVHALLKPLGSHSLEQFLKSVKQFVSTQFNQRLAGSGPLWSQESYDRIVRDEAHLFRVIQYIGNNAAKAGLPRDQWFRWIHPTWEQAGWGFRT